MNNPKDLKQQLTELLNWLFNGRDEDEWNDEWAVALASLLNPSATPEGTWTFTIAPTTGLIDSLFDITPYEKRPLPNADAEFPAEPDTPSFIEVDVSGSSRIRGP